MISHVYAQSHKIVGLYDAPLKYKSGDAVPLSSLALSLSEQIKSSMQVTDIVVLSLRIPSKFEADSDDEPKTKEIKDEDTQSEDALIVDTFIISNSANPKKQKLSNSLNKS